MFEIPIVNGKDFRKTVEDKFIAKLNVNRMDSVREKGKDWEPVKAVERKVVCKDNRKRTLTPDPYFDRLFVELCLSMMTPDWKQRITVEEALRHEVFKVFNITA